MRYQYVSDARELGLSEDASSEDLQRQYRDEKPLEYVQIDYTDFDMMAIEVLSNKNKLPLGRPKLGLGVDKATRVIWGVYLGFEEESTHTLGQVMLNGLLPKTYLERKKEGGEWDIRGNYPIFGIPGNAQLDRARAHYSEAVGFTAPEIGFNVHLLPGKKPWFKGIVERLIGTMNQQIAHSNKGATFSNPQKRGDYNSAEEAVVTLSELQEIIRLWIVGIYHQSIHSGIRDTPLNQWNELTEASYKFGWCHGPASPTTWNGSRVRAQ